MIKQKNVLLVCGLSSFPRNKWISRIFFVTFVSWYVTLIFRMHYKKNTVKIFCSNLFKKNFLRFGVPEECIILIETFADQNRFNADFKVIHQFSDFLFNFEKKIIHKKYQSKYHKYSPSLISLLEARWSAYLFDNYLWKLKSLEDLINFISFDEIKFFGNGRLQSYLFEISCLKKKVTRID